MRISPRNSRSTLGSSLLSLCLSQDTAAIWNARHQDGSSFGRLKTIHFRKKNDFFKYI